MLSVFKNLFFSAPARHEQASRTRLTKASQDQQEKSSRKPTGITPREIDTTFYGLILGVQSPIDSALNGFEKKVLRELDQLLASDVSHSSLVPRLPAVIPRVMSTLRDQSSSAADLAAQLGRDAVLVSEVIRLANSPRYSVGKKITSLERAVFILGQVGVRQLVAHAAFRPLLNLNAGHFTRLAGTMLWDQSEKTAVISDCLARQERTDRFNAYLTAIVQNVGFTVALQILDQNFDGSQAPRSGLFHERLISRSRKLSWVIAREWGFGEMVLDALESQVEDRAMQMPGNILYVADKLSKIVILSGRERFRGDLEQVVGILQGRLTRPCNACLKTLSY